MQYRGVEYMVVRTIPRGWRWSVKRENRTEKRREGAILGQTGLPSLNDPSTS